MKQLGLLALSFLLIPTLASAQPAPDDGGPMPGQGGGAPAGMQQPGGMQSGGMQSGGMQSQRAQILQLRMETRAQMLSALTPQHRTLLASLAGQLATSENPNLQAAARQLDAALTPQESQAIVEAQEALRSQLQGGAQPQSGAYGRSGPNGSNGGYGQNGPNGGYGQNGPNGGYGQNGPNGGYGQGQSGGYGGNGQSGPSGQGGQNGQYGPNGQPGPDGQDGQAGPGGPGAQDGQYGPSQRSQGGRAPDPGLTLLRSALAVGGPTRPQNAP